MKSSATIDVLNEALRVEHTLAMQCQHYALTIRGLWRLSLVSFFEDLADEARGHAQKFGKKVVALGGVPIAEVESVRSSATAEEMVADVLTLERRAMDTYLRALKTVPEDDVALRAMLEDHIEAEQRHIDEIERLVVERGSGDTKNPAAVRRAS